MADTTAGAHRGGRGDSPDGHLMLHALPQSVPSAGRAVRVCRLPGAAALKHAGTVRDARHKGPRARSTRPALIDRGCRALVSAARRPATVPRSTRASSSSVHRARVLHLRRPQAARPRGRRRVRAASCSTRAARDRCATPSRTSAAPSPGHPRHGRRLDERLHSGRAGPRRGRDGDGAVTIDQYAAGGSRFTRSASGSSAPRPRFDPVRVRGRPQWHPRRLQRRLHVDGSFRAVRESTARTDTTGDFCEDLVRFTSAP